MNTISSKSYLFIFKSLIEDMFIDLRKRKREREKERQSEREKKTSIGCLPYMP